MCINVAVMCLMTLFYFIDMCLKNLQVVAGAQPVDPKCMCGPTKCKMGKCWGFNMNLAKRGKTQPPQGAASESQMPQQAASVSPTSPTKSTLTATARSVVGKVAKNTHDAARAAVLKQQQARLVSEKHVCDHFSKCTEGFCQTCKCDKCKARQPTGKRPSALRRF